MLGSLQPTAVLTASEHFANVANSPDRPKPDYLAQSSSNQADLYPMAKQPRARKRPAHAKTPRPTRQRSVTRRKSSAGGKSPEPSGAAAVDARREGYLRAVRLYEQALEALQRREFQTAASRFQQVIDEFPEERELHERSRLYMQACDRQTQPPPMPQTLEEQIYAATLALNAGEQEEALRHLEVAVNREPDSDHVQYMLALARAAGGEPHSAVSHLRRAIELNPDNRLLARQEPSFGPLQDDEAFQQVLRTPPPRRGAGSRSSR